MRFPNTLWNWLFASNYNCFAVKKLWNMIMDKCLPLYVGVIENDGDLCQGSDCMSGALKSYPWWLVYTFITSYVYGIVSLHTALWVHFMTDRAHQCTASKRSYLSGSSIALVVQTFFWHCVTLTVAYFTNLTDIFILWRISLTNSNMVILKTSRSEFHVLWR